MSFFPGTEISTGTPAGVDLGGNASLYLTKKDVIELGIDGLATQR